MIARVLRGGDCPELGEIHRRQASEGWALANSKGLESPAPKQDPNEDSVGVLCSGVGVVAVVADAHFGRLSAEVLVDHLLSAALSQPPPRGGSATERWDWLRARMETANRRVRAQQTRSACAALALIQQGPRAWWASIGDCRLYHVTRGGVRVCNPLTHVYLGDRAAVELELGELTATAGDRLVLATDGLPECIYGRETLPPAVVGEQVRGVEPLAGAVALIEAALRGGGEDNVAVVVGRV